MTRKPGAGRSVRHSSTASKQAMRISTEIPTMPEDGQQVAVDMHISINGAPEDTVPPIGVVTRPAFGVEGQRRRRGLRARAAPIVIAGGIGTGAAVGIHRVTGNTASVHVTVQNLTVDVPLSASLCFVPVLFVLGWQRWRSR